MMFLGDHATVHRRDWWGVRGWCNRRRLADEDEGVGDAVERDGEPPGSRPEPLLKVPRSSCCSLKADMSVPFSHHNRPVGSICGRCTSGNLAEPRNLYPTAWPNIIHLSRQPLTKRATIYEPFQKQAGKEFRSLR